MPTEAKRQEIDSLVKRVKDSEAIFIVEYKGLKVSQATALRKAIRASGGEMRVTKNTLMRIALREAGSVTADEIDFGPNAYVFAYMDAPATARAIRDFVKDKGKDVVTVKGGILSGRIITKDQANVLADLPSRDVMLAALLGTLNGPVRGLVTVLSGPVRGLVTALDQIREQKEKAA
jgi:large subunit ribosomal protein L10